LRAAAHAFLHDEIGERTVREFQTLTTIDDSLARSGRSRVSDADSVVLDDHVKARADNADVELNASSAGTLGKSVLYSIFDKRLKKQHGNVDSSRVDRRGHVDGVREAVTKASMFDLQVRVAETQFIGAHNKRGEAATSILVFMILSFDVAYRRRTFSPFPVERRYL
jgi:hypothetical protein